MLEQIPDKESQNNNKTPPNKPRRKRKRKFGSNQKGGRKDIRRKNSKLTSSMSSWAENFTVAATWQLKHQIAYWKAKAKALEYENKILHDIIRKNNFVSVTSEDRTKPHSDVEDETDSVDPDTETNEDVQDEMDFEVSEEFIQFLAQNAKYKEDARQERERLRAKHEEEANAIQEEPQESTEEKIKKLKDLYGNQWQRISALEIALQSQFINNIDKEKPMYWPNIPFNFNYTQ